MLCFGDAIREAEKSYEHHFEHFLQVITSCKVWSLRITDNASTIRSPCPMMLKFTTVVQGVYRKEGGFRYLGLPSTQVEIFIPTDEFTVGRREHFVRCGCL